MITQTIFNIKTAITMAVFPNEELERMTARDRRPSLMARAINAARNAWRGLMAFIAGII